MLDLEDIADVVASAIKEAQAPLLARIAELEAREIPTAIVGEKGDPGEVDEAVIERMIDAKIAALPPPPKGDPGEVDMEAVNKRIDEAVAAIPRPRDGKSVAIEDVQAMVDKAVSEAVERLPVPKDGVGLADAFKDVDRNLILVMTDGRTKNMGRIDGIDGRHGLNAEDFDVEILDDSKTMRFTARGAGYEHSFDVFLPFPHDKGVYQHGVEYQPGDAVSWGGSLWIAQRSTNDRPDAADSGWRLAVKKGRDGKDFTK